MAGADGGADEASGSESYCVLFLPLRVKLRALMRRARGVLVRDDADSLAAEAIPALAASAVAASVPAAPAADFADSLAAAGGNFELEHADFFFFFTRFFCNDSNASELGAAASSSRRGPEHERDDTKFGEPETWLGFRLKVYRVEFYYLRSVEY